jgi:hypothetical protein
MMKKLITYLILLLIVSFKSFSQSELKVLAFNTPKGVFVQVGSLRDSKAEYLIERKEISFERVGILKRPNSKAELLENINKSKEIFGDDAPTAENIDQVWTKFQSNDSKTISMIEIMPQLSYVFGYSFLDKNATENKKYQYRITHGSLSKTIDFTYKKAWNYGDLNLYKTETNDKKILLWLNANTPYHYLFKFELSRKSISSNQFNKVDAVVAWNGPEKSFVLLDTTLKYNGIYNYSLKVKDVFGNIYPQQLFTKADNIPANVSFNVTKFETQSQPNVREVILNWAFANPEFIQSITLFKSREIDGKYTRLASFSPKENSWKDHIEIANELNFYRFEVIDIFNRKHQSISFKYVYDLDIPATPVSTFAIESLNQYPHLKFSSGDVHTRGFYVYRKTRENDKYLQVSDFILAKDGQGSFIDSSAAFESETLYYTVKAENDTYQKSESSEALSFKEHLSLAKLSDLEPPYDIDLKYENNHSLIYWENMNAKNPRIIAYNIYRKAANEKEPTLINKEPVVFSINSYQDTLKPTHSIYYYYLQSLDSKGNKSLLSQQQILDLNYVGNILPREVGYETMNNGIKIVWAEISSPIAKQIKIYRSENGGKPSLIGNSEPSNQQFTDTKVFKSRNYQYQISVMDVDGKERIINEILSINY